MDKHSLNLPPTELGLTMSRRGSRLNVDEDLLTRTSWVDAGEAYRQLEKGKINGNKCALWLRWRLQLYMYKIGCFINTHCGKVVFVGLLLLSLCCVGLKTAKLETNVEELWVQEGGRLQKELKYTRDVLGVGSGVTSELIIQTPSQEGTNVLGVHSLQLHLETILKITEIEIYMYETTWKFKDMCYRAEFPFLENKFLDQMLDSITPCIVVTPLDCFWDGAKILGPQNPIFTDTSIPLLSWKNLNPQELVKQMKAQYPDAAGLETMEEMMHEAGITTAYMEKPCLDPYESECPDSAPNKQSKRAPDVGAELTDGCYGFATKHMHWHEDLIVGGSRKNRTGHIVRAEALQSIIQLLGEKELFDYYQDKYKVHTINWSQDKAKALLEAWQRKLVEVVHNAGTSNSSDNLYGFTETSLMDIMKEFSNVSIVRVALGYVLMIFYACISLLRWNNGVQSQSGIGIAGVLLVALSVAAGLGICSVLGILFNASTTQIIPFLALGLGVDDMFLVAHTYYENSNKKSIPTSEQTGECLKRAGVSVLLTSVNNMLAFFASAIIPIPALRAFSLQAGILILFNLITILLVFPAICSFDLKRKEDKRMDIFCCFQSYGELTNTTGVINRAAVLDIPMQEKPDRERSPPPAYNAPPYYSQSPPPSYNAVVHTGPNGEHAVTSLTNHDELFAARPTPIPSVCGSTTSSRQCLAPEDPVSCSEQFTRMQKECLTTNLTSLATRRVGPFLKKPAVKVFSILLFLIWLFVSCYGITKVKDGLDLTDIVPKDTPEYDFLKTQSKYFGFYNVYMVTKDGFDYPKNQELLYQYHQSFQSVRRIIKREGGSMPTFWLTLFKNWLQDLQDTFDKEYAEGRLYNGHWHYNASDKAILAYKLIIQTGDVDKPYNEDLIGVNRLVSESGIIKPEPFYNYLTAWTSNDILGYAASKADFHPEPKMWSHDPMDVEKRIPKSQPLIFAQIPFFLTNMSDTEVILDTIKEIRDICDTYTDKGLPNYPSGIPFTYWEQYLHLRLYLMVAILCALLVIFVVLTIVLMNPWLASIVVVVLSCILVELFGFMGLSDIKLSAVPAVILIVSVGIGVEFTVHVALCFLTAIGSRNKRMVMSLEHTFAPVVHGAISTLLGIIMLVGADFDFIVKYFFSVLAALVVIGLMNGLVLLPVLLSLIGPKGEVRPIGDIQDRIDPPTPELKKKKKNVQITRSSKRMFPRIPSDISLTTITEEPSQYSSHEIVVEPEVVVETSTVPPAASGGGGSNSSSRNSTPPSSCISTPITKHVTRVKAKATVTVEVHSPITGTCETTTTSTDPNYKRKRRKHLEQDSSDSDSSSKS